MTLWLLGGLDPSGGAGLLRDFATASTVAPRLPVHCMITAWTRQGHGLPATAEPVCAARLEAQLCGLPLPRAIKVGLVPAPLVDALLEMLSDVEAPLIIDPVLRASDGGALGSTPEALSRLLTRATLITPNWDEAAALVGRPPPGISELDALVQQFPKQAILLKGGHERGVDRVIDRLWWGGRRRDFVRPRLHGLDPRGTGCSLATAIACALAQGCAIEDAVAGAIDWLDRARKGAFARGEAMHLPI